MNAKRAQLRQILIVLGFVELAFLVNSTFASVITLEGTTTGSFPSNVSGLTFTGKNFSFSTDSAGNATVDLGTLNWVSGSVNKVDNALSLTVQFDDLASTPASKTFTADIWSSWNGYSGFGDVWFDDVSPTHFAYTTPSGTGSFDLAIAGRLSNGKSWGAGDTFVPHRWFNLPYHGSVQVTGTITNATFTPVPEPVSMTFLLAGGLGLWFRRNTIN